MVGDQVIYIEKKRHRYRTYTSNYKYYTERLLFTENHLDKGGKKHSKPTNTLFCASTYTHRETHDTYTMEEALELVLCFYIFSVYDTGWPIHLHWLSLGFGISIRKQLEGEGRQKKKVAAGVWVVVVKWRQQEYMNEKAMEGLRIE